MDLRLALALTAVIGLAPVVVAQHGLHAASGAPAALECKVGIVPQAAAAVGSKGPVRETRLIGAAAAGNLVCVGS